MKTSLKKRICHPFKALFGPAQFVKCWPVFLEWILKEFIQVQKRKEYCCLIFTATATIKRRIRKFHVYVAQLTSKKKKNILRKKRDASAELLFCLKTNRFIWRCHRRRRPVPVRMYWTINILRKKRDASAERLFCLKTNRFFWRCHRRRRPVPVRMYWTIIRQ